MKKAKEEKINFVYGITPEEDAYYKSVVTVKGENSLSKSILNVLNGPDQQIERLAFETDPTQYNTYAGIYKQKMRLLPDAVLKRIAIQDSLVSNIVRARQNHVSAFGRPRPDRFSTGYIIRPNAGVTDGMDSDKKRQLAEDIQRAIRLFNTCGHTDGVKDHCQKTFSEYVSLVVRDSQVVGRIATEVVSTDDIRTNDKKFHYFCHTDAGTIYPAAVDNESAKQAIRDEAFALIQSVTGRKDLVKENWNKDHEYVWVQVIDGRPFEVFTNKEMKCKNFYPVGNVELDGFPVTPIDTVISAITTHLNITTHNKVYFQSGRATRGMLIIKSDDVNPTMIHNIKQHFNASINSAGNCIDGSSTLWTKQYGQITVAELEAKVNGVDLVDIWTGKGWEKATAYKTGVKDLIETTLDNGIVVKTSPDHRFRVVNDEGELVWKLQSELKVGDYIAVNKKSSSKDEVPLFNGKEIDEDFMEVMGWITGDGTIQRDKTVELFYHPELEVWIRDRHFDILQKWGFPVYKNDKDLTQEEVDEIKREKGFKSVIPKIIRTTAHCVRLVRELLNLGFTSSRRGNADVIGKTIPSFVYTLPEKLKASFLRGLFSADGNNHKLLSPCLTVVNNKLREQTKLLLLSMGIRTTFSEGRTKSGRLVGRGLIEAKSLLRIKDRNEFFDKIGFLQPHKQPRQAKGTNKDWGTSNSISRQTVIKYLKLVKEKTKRPHGGNNKVNALVPWIFNKRQQMDIDAILRDEDSCSLNRLLNYMRIAQINPPQWMLDYNFEPIVEIVDTEVQVPMFDIEVHDDDHCVGVCGVMCHNSWRMPVLGFNTDAEVDWKPIDVAGGRDMEFQYLTDLNAREILTSFMMSPDELPGWSYLSRGTNSQALSEGNNEFRLEAGRDVGIRPILSNLEDYINAELFPLIDPELCKICRFVFAGLDADSPEKEIVNIQQNSQVWMSMNDILEKVERKPIPKEYGGEFLLNPSFVKVCDAYLTIGEILEFFFNRPGASKDPKLQYRRDPMYFTNEQLMQSNQQLQMQQQQMQQQAAQQPQIQGQDPNQANQDQQQVGTGPADLARSIDQAYELMTKSEANMTPNQRKLLQKQQKMVKWLQKGFEDDVEDTITEILEVAKQAAPKK
jgi:hypothetical protein